MNQEHTFVARRMDVFVLRAPIAVPVRTSFGVMHDRPAVIVRVEDADGVHGWGECWCNFPTCGAEHRARLLSGVVGPLLLGKPFTSPEAASSRLGAQLQVLALQADEPGPLAQALAAVDIALWDMEARRAGQPLFRFLGGMGTGSMPVYASGINPVGLEATLERSRAGGFTAFKFKVGFDREQDLRNAHTVLGMLQSGEQVAVDANQAWDLPTALAMAEAWEGVPLAWLEEPLCCDTHISQWRLLAAHCTVPLAAGENLRRREDFRTAMDSGALAVLQPDMCKWGGISQCRWVAVEALRAGRRYCPHYLGGGIGLLASAHLLAAVGGDGLLEVDVNENPLRDLLAQPFPIIESGRIQLSDMPGLGVEPDLAAVAPFVREHVELRESGSEVRHA